MSPHERRTTRPTITVQAAVDAAAVLSTLERERAEIARNWEKLHRLALSAPKNGAHIGNFYASRGRS